MLAIVREILLFLVIYSIRDFKRTEATFGDSQSIHQTILQNCNDTFVSACPAMCTCCNALSNVSQWMLKIEGNLSKKAVFCIGAGMRKFPSSLPQNTTILFLEFNHFETLNVSLLTLNNTEKHSTEFQFQYVSLRNNDIIHIDDDIFHNCTFLESLILSDNDISSLDWTKGLWNSPLVYMDLSFNKITKITNNSFGNLKYLKRLILSHNSISSIGPSAFEPIFRLQFLDLSANHFHADDIYENSFSDLEELSYLSLADNRQLERLPLFKFIGIDKTKLETLDLHGLPFVHFIQPQTFYGLESLITLNLSSCGLQELMLGWLDGGPQKSLKALDLSYNKFKTIRDYFFVATEISNFCPYKIEANESSDLTSNVRYRKLYRDLKQLSWLSLEDNHHLRLFEDDTFTFLPQLQYLFLQRCNVSKLKLASTAVQYHEDAIHDTFPNLRGVWVFDNPLHCDCRVANVIDESLSFTGSNIDNAQITDCENARKFWSNGSLLVDTAIYYYEGRCRTVAAVRISNCFPFYDSERIPLKDVPRSYLRCPEEPIAFFVAVIIGPLAFVTSITIMLLCGLCKVFISRFHRSYIAMYHPKYYLLDARYKKALASRNSSTPLYNSPSSRRDPRQKMTASPSAGRFHPRLQFRTNAVLGSMSALRGSNNQLHFLHPQNYSKRKGSPSAFPSRMSSPKRSFKLQHQTTVDEVPPSYQGLELQSYCPDVVSNCSQSNPFSWSMPDKNGSNPSISSKSESKATPFKNRLLPAINKPRKSSSQINEYRNSSSCENSLLRYIDDDDVSQKSETEFFVPKFDHGTSIPGGSVSPGVMLENRFLLGAERGDSNGIVKKQEKRERWPRTRAIKLWDTERDYHSS